MNSDDSNLSNGSFPKTWIKKLLRSIGGEPENREQLIELLRDAKQRALLDTNALSMMEGVLQVSEMRVRDIMIPRANIVVVERDAPLEQILPTVVDSAHSRFPVIVADPAWARSPWINRSVFCPPNSMWAYNSETDKSFLNPNTTISSSFEDTDDPPVIRALQDVQLNVPKTPPGSIRAVARTV